MSEDTVERGGRRTTTRHDHLSLRRLAQADLAGARAQWSIESGLPWRLDVLFDEDRARNRKDQAPDSIAIRRKLALDMLNKARRDLAIRRKRKRSGWSDDVARSIIGQIRLP